MIFASTSRLVVLAARGGWGTTGAGGGGGTGAAAGAGAGGALDELCGVPLHADPGVSPSMYAGGGSGAVASSSRAAASMVRSVARRRSSTAISSRARSRMVVIGCLR